MGLTQKGKKNEGQEGKADHLLPVRSSAARAGTALPMHVQTLTIQHTSCTSSSIACQVSLMLGFISPTG